MTDIARLMAEDPLNLTRDDLTQMVAYFRGTRKQFNLGNLKAGSTKPPTEKQKAVKDLLGKLDLGGLEL